jgi:SAM-dependent methyltransferase
MFLLVNLILLIFVFFLLLILSMIWPPDSPWAPWWRTNRKVARAMCKIAKISSRDVIYDLGSGDGTALLIASEEWGAKGVGIEIDPIRAVIAKCRIMMSKKNQDIIIKRRNFFEVQISDATVIFVYLVPKALRRLRQKFFHELKPGTKIISYQYEIDYLPLVDKNDQMKIFVYTMPQRDNANKQKN